MSDETKEKIRDLCLDGLYTDGEHHKQWSLEEILKALGYDLRELRAQAREIGYGVWETGIAP